MSSIQVYVYHIYHKAARGKTRGDAFERSASTEKILLLIDIIVYTYQKSWQQVVIMMTDQENSSAHVDDSKKYAQRVHY